MNILEELYYHNRMLPSNIPVKLSTSRCLKEAIHTFFRLDWVNQVLAWMGFEIAVQLTHLKRRVCGIGSQTRQMQQSTKIYGGDTSCHPSLFD